MHTISYKKVWRNRLLRLKSAHVETSKLEEDPLGKEGKEENKQAGSGPARERMQSKRIRERKKEKQEIAY